MYWTFLLLLLIIHVCSYLAECMSRGHMCFAYHSLVSLMFDKQFARTEDGVCGLLGLPAQWPVGKDRSPGYDTAMLPCLSLGAKTVREVGERLSAALLSRVPVSIAACEGSNAASLLQQLAFVSNNQTSSCLMAPLRQHSSYVMASCLLGKSWSTMSSVYFLLQYYVPSFWLWLLFKPWMPTCF